MTGLTEQKPPLRKGEAAFAFSVSGRSVVVTEATGQELRRHLPRPQDPDQIILLDGHVHIRLQNGQAVALQTQDHAVILLPQAAGADGFALKLGGLLHGDDRGIHVVGVLLVLLGKGPQGGRIRFLHVQRRT